jgi:hypothetical protein
MPATAGAAGARARQKARETAEAGKRVQEATKGSPLLRWLKGLFKESTGRTPLIFILPPPEAPLRGQPGSGVLGRAGVERMGPLDGGAG